MTTRGGGQGGDGRGKRATMTAEGIRNGTTHRGCPKESVPIQVLAGVPKRSLAGAKMKPRHRGRNQEKVISVLTYPGESELTLTRCFTSSFAIPGATDLTAPFVPQYALLS